MIIFILISVNIIVIIIGLNVYSKIFSTVSSNQ